MPRSTSTFRTYANAIVTTSEMVKSLSSRQNDGDSAFGSVAGAG